jgi:hypothetical protein
LLGAGAAFGDTPTVVPAIFAGFELRFARLSLGLEARGDFAGHETVPAGSFSTWLLLGELVPCYHLGLFGACGLIAAGARNSKGDAQHSSTTPYFALGARAAVDLPLLKWFLVRPELDLLIPTTSVTLDVADLPAWNSPPVAAVAGIALVAVLK